MMKKILLLLLTFISVQSFANLSRTAQFDFAHPSTLSPAVTIGTYHAAFAMVTEETFTDGLATISFSNGNAELDTWNPTGGNNPSYYLSLSRGTYLVVTVKQGCTLNKVTINKNSSDAVYLLADRGSYNSAAGVWTPGADSHSQVGLYYTSAQAPVIEDVQVDYTEPSMVLTAQIPSEYSEPLKTFSQLEVTFPNAQDTLTVLGAPNVTIQGSYDNEAFGTVNTTMTVKASSTAQTAVFTLATPIEHDGTFTIHVPDLAFRDAAGYETIGFDVTIVVREERAKFDVQSVKIASGDGFVDLDNQDIYGFPNPEEIFLEFASNVGHIDETAEFEMKREGVVAPVARMKLEMSGTDNKKVKLVIVPGSKASDEWPLGKYTLKVAKKVIFDNNYNTIWETYNPETNITFNIVEKPNPLQPKLDELAELKTEAGELYAQIGKVGYPKTDMSPNKLEDLKDVVAATTNDNGELDTQIDNLKAAIKAFYNVTDVQLPESSKWYTIASVNKAGSELALSYANGAVTLGGTATAFQVESITDGVAVLKVKAGKDSQDQTVYKYLHVLMDKENTTPTSSKNVTDTYTDQINKLTLAKLSIGTIGTDDQKPYAGLLTIEGNMGYVNEVPYTEIGSAKALVDHSTGKIITDKSETTLYFEDDKSSAFRFVETDEPSDEPVTPPAPAVSPKAHFNGSELDSNEKMLTLIIDGKANEGDVTNVSLATPTAPYFVVKNADDSEGSQVTTFTGTTILEKLEDGTHNNYFKVHVNGLADGDYYLILPVGTFAYTENVTDERMRADFTISSSGSGGGSGSTHSFIKDLAQAQPYSSSPYFDGDVAVNPVVLNDFRVYSYKREGETEQTFFADTQKKVILAGYFNSQEYWYGHFELDPNYNPEQVWCYKIVWEPTITESDFSGYVYNLGIKVEEETFGDKNFNAWLNNPGSVSEGDCHVNTTFVTFVKVDASVPTGISTLSVDDAAGKVIYDLQGRRVQNMDKKGIYIVNGRKVVIK